MRSNTIIKRGAGLLLSLLLLTAMNGRIMAQTTADAGNTGHSGTQGTASSEQTAAYVTPSLSDGDILHIFIALNNSEIVSSMPAKGDAEKDFVRKYAADMIQKHQDALNAAMDLTSQPGLTPKSNVVSVSMDRMAQGVASRLQGLSGAKKAEAYFTAQVIQHQQFLDLLDFVLIPGAKNPQLRNMLQEGRGRTAGYLKEAQDLFKKAN